MTKIAMSDNINISTGNRIFDLRITSLLNKWLLILDFALLVTAFLMISSIYVVFYFHIIFVILTFGAFFWKLRGFAFRASFWVTVTAATVLGAVLAGRTQPDELIEIPLLTCILVLVFIIARQRSKAEDALRQANGDLESRVGKRTAELTKVNTELLQEIVRHQQTETTLRESEERYRSLVELSFEGVIIHRHGKIISINAAGAKLLGANSPLEILGRLLCDFIHPDNLDTVWNRLHQVEENGKGMPPVEEHYIRLDGTSLIAEVAAIPIIYQGQAAVQVVVRDVTVRKQAQLERERERTRIARDLHDSLGQSLGYLRLKLDEFTLKGRLNIVSEVHRDLTLMRDVANEAYELVRSMLAAAHPANSTNLNTALYTLARSVGNRANFKVRFITEDQSRSLSPIVQQQVLYIFKEALSNVEKHSNAHEVSITVLWTDKIVSITFIDDGCGFETGLPRTAGHYGLTIMQERAEEINAFLAITSSPGEGTKLDLRLPLVRSLQPVTLYD